MSILAPEFLTSNIRMISLILAAAVLIIFGSFVKWRIVFPLGDLIRKMTVGTLRTHRKLKKHDRIITFFGQSLATLLFLTYCYLGVSIISEYFFEPLLHKSKHLILIIVIVIFAILNVVINNDKLRDKLMKH